MSWSEIKKKREQETSTPLSKAVNNVTGGLWKQVGQGIIQSNKERQARQKKEEEEKKKREELLRSNKPAIPTTYQRNTPSATQMLVNNPNVKIATPEEMKNTKELNSWNKIKMIADNAGKGGINGLLGVAQTTERSHQDTRNIANNISTGILQGLFGLFGDKGKAMGNLALAGSQMITNKEKQQAEEDIESLKQARNKTKQEIAENSRMLDASGDVIASKLGSLAPSIGQQVPGMIATALNPVAGFVYYKLSSEADYYDDAKERGMNDTESRIYSKIMSYVEAGTETVSASNIIKGGKAIKAITQGIKNGGVKTGLKAGIDIFKDTAEKETVNTVKEALKNYGIGIAEEGFQEAITEPIQELTAMTVGGKDKADWNNMWNRMVESGIDGALSSAIIAGANMGYSSCKGIIAKLQNGQKPTSQEFSAGIKEVSKDFDIQKNIEDSIKRNVVKLKAQEMANQNVNNQPTQQITQVDNNVIEPQTKVSQNGTSQEQNTLLKKVDAIKDNISEDDYNQLRDMVNNNEYESAEYFNDFVKQVNQMSIEQNYKSSDFRTDQDRKRMYSQYQRQNNTNGIKYNNYIVDNALDTIKANRNGRRTVGQWKQVASQIGLEASDLSKADIDNIAYGSWFDLQPSKNITKYDNRTKERKGFERLTSNEWINAIYESARNQKIQNSDTALEQYSLSEETPQNNFKYEKSDNAKVDTFRQDASRYWDNSEKTSKLVNTIEKIINDKGYNIRLDDTLGDNVNGRIVTNPETGETEITINPNSNRKGEFIIGHELTHAIETKEMVDLVKSRMQKDGELRNAVEDLKRLYGTDDINAEVLADISGQLFGNQEFINNLSTEKPSVFKRIYDTIVSLANKITGNSNEALFIKDLKNKWEKAYRENTNNIKNAEYSLNRDGAMKDNKTGKKVTLQAETTNNGKNLLAIHNLDESKLKGVLELGGFPVPSIAITNPNIVGHSEFGDISVIFNKETINPKSRKNEVYDRDVWSPTIPRIEYEADADNIKSIQTLLDINKNYSEKDDIQRQATRDLSKEEVERMLNNYDGIKGLKDSIKDNKNVQYTYLKSKGLIEPIMKQVQFNNHVSNEVLQNFIDKYSEMTDYSATTPLNELSYDQTMQLSNKIKEIVKPYLEEQYGKYGKDGQEVIKSELKRYDDYSGINNFIYSAQSMLRNGQDLTEIDKSATFDKVNEKINKEEFNKWIDENITDSIIKDKGFDNGKERLTPQGNRRSFKATHNEFNLENLVKALSREETKGGQEVSIFGTGFGRISAQTANRFNSIKDIKNNESRLMTREQAQEVIQPLAEQLFEKVDNLANYYTRNDYNSDTVNHMQGVDTTSELIEEFAGGTLSEERLKRILDEYYVYDTDKIPSDLLKGIIEDLKQVKNLPTDYFEAKPQRAVGFDEIDAIVIPKDLSKEVKQQLKDRGIKTIEYDRNNENERADILKSLNEYKFSKTSKSWQDYLEKNYKSEGTTTDLRDIRLPMKQKQEVKLPMKENIQQTQENAQNNNTPGETINWNEIQRPENNQKFRKHYKSIIESSNTTAEAKKIAKELMGMDTYTPQTNKGQLAQADQRIMTSSPETELQSLLSRAMNGEKITPIDIAVGERLIQYFSKTGDAMQLQEAIQATAIAGTSAGQTVQALAMLNHQTPQGQATWIQRSVDKMNKELARRKGGTITTDTDGNLQVINKQGKDITNKVDLFDLTPEMINKIMNSENQEQMYKNIDEVYEELGQQVPKGFLEKIDSWRYFSMLANARTHIRNMVGNVAMGKMQRAKDKLAGGLEDIVSKFNPDMERTKTLRRADAKTKEFAKQDFKNMDVQSMLELNENKYNPQSRLQNARRTFKNQALENTLGRLFNLNDKLLSAEDGIGLKSAYQKALADYITANKIDVDNITDAQLGKARNYAVQQAKEATFHQANAIASAVAQFENKNLATKLFTGAVLPFKKTPMNVAKAGMEYSPLQIAKSATVDLVNLRKGNISINQYIDNLSKGMTGTGVALVGYALANAGILKASGGDDKDKEKYDEEQGKQSYSIQIAGKTYSLDWLAPTGIPLFIGAETYKLFNQEDTEKSSEKSSEENRLNQAIKGASNLLNAGATAINPMSEMSMISGLTSALSSYNTSDNLGSLGNIMTNAGKSYINQFFPTLMGQVAKTGDEYERTTKSTATGTIGKAVDQTINQIKAKVPGLRQTLPIKTDIWGKDIKQEVNLPLRALNNFINPATVKEVSTDKVDKELNKLYEENKNSALLPDILTKTVQLNGQTYRLSNKEYAEFTKNYGQTSHKLIEDFIKTSDYSRLTQEQKETAISDIYSYAKEQNKLNYAEKVDEDVKPTTLYTTMEAISKNGGKQSEYLNYLAKTKGMSKEVEKNEVLANSNYSNKTKEIIYTNGTGKDDNLYNNLLSKSNINMTEYLNYKNKVSNKEFSADKDSNGKTISGSAKTKVINYLNNNITGAGNRLLIAGNSYALTNSEKQKLAQYINQIATTKEARLEIYEQLDKNFTVKDGKVYIKVSSK